MGCASACTLSVNVEGIDVHVCDRRAGGLKRAAEPNGGDSFEFGARSSYSAAAAAAVATATVASITTVAESQQDAGHRPQLVHAVLALATWVRIQLRGGRDVEFSRVRRLRSLDNDASHAE